jgi:hypothetical protein
MGTVDSRRMRHLRQETSSRISGADQRDANRLAGRKAGVEEAVKVHGDVRSELGRVPDAMQRATRRRRVGTIVQL